MTIAVERLTFPGENQEHYGGLLLVLIITFRYSSNDSGQDEDSKVAGEDPDQVGEGNA